jgi:large conductance mechanosensitive channel
MSILEEFKKFALKGNMLDMAVGIMIGAAFSTVVNSFVTDILMPLLGLILGKVDFSNLYINLSGGSFTTLAEAQANGAVTINYGIFINSIISFLIVAVVMFWIIRGFNRIEELQKNRKEEPVIAPTHQCPYCQMSIPDGARRCPHCTSNLDGA